MSYSSLEEIKKEFGLESDDIGALKKQLKGFLKDIHSDKGEYRNKLDELNHYRIQEALNFLNKGFELVERSKFNELVKTVNDLAPLGKNQNIEKKEEKLIVRTSESIRSVRTTNLFPKISSTAITSAITAFWLFPDTITEHKVLSKYIDPEGIIFGMFYSLVLMLTGTYWLITSMRENRLKEALKKLRLETIQNKVFYDFKSHLEFGRQSSKESITFTKDQLTEYIHDLNIVSLRYSPRILNSFPFLLSNRNIDLEIAQMLSDMIIDRVLMRNIIDTIDSTTIATMYKVKASNSR